MRSGRLATASSACHNGRGGETAKPGKQAPGEKMAVCGVCTETCSLPRMPALDTAACWTIAWQRRCLDGPIRVDRTAVVRAQEGAIRETTATNRRHCVAVLGSTNAVGLCRTATRAGVRRGWRTSVATAAASACGGKPSRLIHRTMAWRREWAAIAGGGLGLQGAPRPGRPALSAQASADRPARRPRRCTDSGRRRTRVRGPSACRARPGCSQ